VVTPYCYKEDLGKKQIRFNGFFELGYLHPNYFKPDPSVLDELKLNRNERIIILRFVAWNASHDIGDAGFSDKASVVETLSKYGKILITSEIELPSELEKYKLLIPPEKMHHLMHYADLFIGESATMAAECAILGTPAIFVSTSRRGYTDELESKYDMLYSFSNPENAQEDAMKKAIELLEDKSTGKKWKDKKDRLFKDTVDVTKFMTEFIESYV
jgi:predicted glycosyltransferase